MQQRSHSCLVDFCIVASVFKYLLCRCKFCSNCEIFMYLFLLSSSCLNEAKRTCSLGHNAILCQLGKDSTRRCSINSHVLTLLRNLVHLWVISLQDQIVFLDLRSYLDSGLCFPP
ncbi:hypothetical protein Droror1_Dr00003995 [Drosera rotundifolia]